MYLLPHLLSNPFLATTEQQLDSAFCKNWRFAHLAQPKIGDILIPVSYTNHDDTTRGSNVPMIIRDNYLLPTHFPLRALMTAVDTHKEITIVLESKLQGKDNVTLQINSRGKQNCQAIIKLIDSLLFDIDPSSILSGMYLPK